LSRRRRWAWDRSRSRGSKYDNAAEVTAKVLGCPWRFRKHGDCGMDFSELLPRFGEIADDLTLIRSMTTITHHDYHATLLHVFGLDPKKLTFTRNATPQSLIDATASARVVTEVLR
jgi:hypothetical protein